MSLRRSFSRFREATWIDRFCNNPDNCYMCEVDEDYIRDSFNLYGLDSGCALYKPAINLILDSESSSDDSSSGSARGHGFTR